MFFKSLADLLSVARSLDAEFIAAFVTVFFVGWFMWQFYAPLLLDRDTVLRPLFEVPERLEDVEERQTELRERLKDIDKQQVHHIQVTRANSRALDPEKDVEISSDEVDNYLVDNGVPVTVFTVDASDDRSPPTAD